MTEEQCKKLKAGTKIRFKSTTFCGDAGIIGEIVPEGANNVCYVKTDDEHTCSCYDNWELLEPRPFKVGDRVRKIADYGSEIGKTGRIKVIEGEKYGLSWDDGEFPNDNARYTSEELELVEPVKEKLEEDVHPVFYGKSLVQGRTATEIILEELTSPPLTTRTMRKLSELSASVRRAFSPEQRKLYKAGFIDSCGKYTDAAKDEVLNVLCDEHKEKLVEFAKEAIETAKEDKEDDE